MSQFGARKGFIDQERANREDERPSFQICLKKVQSLGIFYVKRREMGGARCDCNG